MRHFAGMAAASVVPSSTVGVRVNSGAIGPNALRNGDELAAAPCEGPDQQAAARSGAGLLQQWELVAITGESLSSELRKCADYAATAKCAWTAEWGCSAATAGTSGLANDDGSIGYFCCCVATGHAACADSAAAGEGLAAFGTDGSSCAAARSGGSCSVLRVALLCAHTCGLCAALPSTAAGAAGPEAVPANGIGAAGGAMTMMVRLRGTGLCVDVKDGKLMARNPLQVGPPTAHA